MKMKKLTALVLAFLTVLSCAAILSSCSKKSEPSSYDLAKQAGFTGTEEEWNALLNGAKVGGEDVASTSTRYEYAPDGTRKKVTEITLADGTVKTVTEDSQATYVRKGFAYNEFYEFPEGKEGSLLFIAVDETGHTEYREVRNEDLTLGSVNWQVEGEYPIVYEFDGELIRHTVSIGYDEPDDPIYHGYNVTFNYPHETLYFLQEDENGNPIFDDTGFSYRFKAYDYALDFTHDFVSPFDEYGIELFTTARQFRLNTINGDYGPTHSYRSAKLSEAELTELHQSVSFREGDEEDPTLYVPIGAETPFDGLSDVFVHTIKYNEETMVYFTLATVNDLSEPFSAEEAGTTEYHFKKVNGLDVENTVKVVVFDPADCEASGVTELGSGFTGYCFDVSDPDSVALRAVYSAPDASRPIIVNVPLTQTKTYEDKAELTTVGVKCLTVLDLGYELTETFYAYDDEHNVIAFYPAGLASNPSFSSYAVCPVGCDIEAELLGTPMDGRYFVLEYAAPVDGQYYRIVPFDGEMISFSSTDTSKPGTVVITVSYNGIMLTTVTVTIEEITNLFEEIYLGGSSSYTYTLYGDTMTKILFCQPEWTEKQFLDIICSNCYLEGYLDDDTVDIPLTPDLFDLSAVDFTKPGFYPVNLSVGGQSCGDIYVGVWGEETYLLNTFYDTYHLETFQLPVSKTPISNEDLLKYAQEANSDHCSFQYFRKTGDGYSYHAIYEPFYLDSMTADFSKVDTTKEGEYTATFSYSNATIPMTVKISADPQDVLYLLAYDTQLYLPVGSRTEIPAESEYELWAYSIADPSSHVSVNLHDAQVDFSKVDLTTPGYYETTVTYQGLSTEIWITVYDPACNISDAYVSNYYGFIFAPDAGEKDVLKNFAYVLSRHDVELSVEYYEEIAPGVTYEHIELTEENLAAIFGLSDEDFIRPGDHIAYGSYTAPGRTVPFTGITLHYGVSERVEDVTSIGAYSIPELEPCPYVKPYPLATLYSDGLINFYSSIPSVALHETICDYYFFDRIGENKILVNTDYDLPFEMLFTVNEADKTLTFAKPTGKVVKSFSAEYYDGETFHFDFYEDGTVQIALGEAYGNVTVSSCYTAIEEGWYIIGKNSPVYVGPNVYGDYIFD